MAFESTHFEHCGVQFDSIHDAPIGTSSEYDLLSEQLGTGNVHLPDMVHVHNKLVIRNIPSGTSTHRLRLEITPKGALQQWRDSHGDTLLPTAYNWTYMTHYDGNLYVTDERDCVLSDETPRVELSDDRLPLDKLQRRDPILFFSAVTLFGDELHDWGIVEASVKLRVMPTFFLLLIRCYLRLDNSEVQLRDCRYFHEFGTNKLIKDVQMRQRDIDSVKRLLRPKLFDATNTNAAHYTDAHPQPQLQRKHVTYECPGESFLKAVGGSAVAFGVGDDALNFAITADEVYGILPPSESATYNVVW